MNVTCDKCNKRYSIADDKVRGKSVKIRCKQCQNLISVQGPAAEAGAAASAGAAAAASASAGIALGGGPAVAGSPWEEERTRAMPAMDTSAQWFAMVKGKQLGPFDLRGLEGKVKTGELTLRTYLWKQGMGDWKRASDVPEVSPVFAGVAVGATATGLTSAAAPERPSSKRVPAVQRDVALALETPSPEITARKTNGNGNGHGHVAERAPDPVTQPVTRGKVPSVRVPAVARPAPLPAPLPDAAPTAPVPAPTPLVAKPQALKAPLSDLFGGDAEHAPSDHGPIGDMAPDEGAEKSVENDPFAALGPGDPSQVPAPGEATKFFIAQAGVHKRNPPWKIALFVLGGPGLIVGVLFLLSTLKIVPLEVTRTNEAGEEVKESFFSPGGVSGIKDLFSGEAAKKKAEAEKLRQAAAERRRIAAANHDRPDKPDKLDPKAEAEREAEKARLALVYGGNSTEVKPTRVPKDRNAGGTNTVVESSGLSQEASQKVVADKIKAFEGCIEQALRRNPNLAVGPIDVVLNVGASGAVTSASISPPKHNNTDWGQCMRDVGKRIVFPRSDGDSEVSLPLKVGVAVSP